MIHTGDCLEVLPTLAERSIDAVVTDPPYGIGFMGHEWDQPGDFGPVSRDHGKSSNISFGGPPHAAMETGRYDLSLTANRRYQAWCEAWGRELLRVAKPGAHLLVFGGTRTYHRLTAGLEDAGWEIRDCLVWGYASGFPKSLDVSKAIDRAAGATREVVGELGGRYSRGFTERSSMRGTETGQITAPATPDAVKWQGWGTALKPAWEPIVLARKPLVGSVAANVLAHGTGALNVDAARIPVGDVAYSRNHSGDRGHAGTRSPGQDGATDISAGGGSASARGRWPSNLLLTDAIFDGGIDGVVGGGVQSGGGNPRWQSPDASAGQYGGYAGGDTGKLPIDTAGTYSRFFVIPKADRTEREPALGGLAESKYSVAGTPAATLRRCVNCRSARLGDGGVHICRDGCPEKVLIAEAPTSRARANVHPTVKPLDLMRHLVRLVTPPGGLVLDPFLGSGTTALAAELEGFPWVGIEREAEYVAIAEARLNGIQRGFGLAG